MHSLALIPWLDPAAIIEGAGPWALLVVCFIVFAETGLLIGFLLPGDTLLVISGLLSHSTETLPHGVFGLSVWWVALLIALAAFESRHALPLHPRSSRSISTSVAGSVAERNGRLLAAGSRC